MDSFTLETSPITMAKVDGDCACVVLLGHIEAGETVPCPHGDHDHYVLEAFPTEAATNIRIVSISEDVGEPRSGRPDPSTD